MAEKKKRMTQRQKDERARLKKQLQAKGVLPPNKPRLNRRKFAKETWEEFQSIPCLKADFYLRQAIRATVGPDMQNITPEEVGILKLMKLAVEMEKYMKQLQAEGRDRYTLGEFYEKVYRPVMRL